MKKIALSLIVTSALSFTFFNNAHAAEAENENLTVKQGETEVQKYLKAQHLNYTLILRITLIFFKVLMKKPMR